MPCFSPLSAWQTDGGDIVFAERGNIARQLDLPCGQCIGCKLQRSRHWALRIMHEAQLHKQNSFVTFTYDEEYYRPSLEYRDFQLFMKRLRRRFGKGKVRFYMAGEYGELYLRPHYHACLFGVGFADKELISMRGGHPLYRSPTLEKLWPFGYSSIGELTLQSAQYVAQYVTKKRTGPNAADYYKRVVASTGEVVQVKPEFSVMSRRPGIGHDWIKKYKRDVYPSGTITLEGGVRVKAPRFYDQFMERTDYELKEDADWNRYVNVMRERQLNPGEHEPHRLRTRQEFQVLKLRQKKRELE